MNKKTTILFLVSCLLGSGLALAADYDGSKNLLCASQIVLECVPNGGCNVVPAENVGAPDFIKLNFKKKELTVPGTDRPASAIENQESVDGKLIVQGIEDGVEGVRDGTGWTIAIDEATGKMVATASGDAAAFVLFGACTQG